LCGDYLANFYQGSVSCETLARSFSLLVAAISSREVLDTCTNDSLRSVLAQHLTETFIQLLRGTVSLAHILGENSHLAESLSSKSQSLLNGALLNRLLQVLYDSKELLLIQNSVPLISSLFEAILEASMHSSDFWNTFQNHERTPKLIFELLLDDPRVAIRKATVKQIAQKCSYTPG
jgi:hypothetical protein